MSSEHPTKSSCALEKSIGKFTASLFLSSSESNLLYVFFDLKKNQNDHMISMITRIFFLLFMDTWMSHLKLDTIIHLSYFSF